MSYERKEREAHAAWRTGQVGGNPLDIPSPLYRAISDYGTARANLAIKARHGGLSETGNAQVDVAAAMRVIMEEFTLLIREMGLAT